MSEVSRDLETWLPVVGWEDLYEVSDRGRVAGKARQAKTKFGDTCWRPGRILQGRETKKGYVIVTLNRSRGVSVQKRVHRLVLEALSARALKVWSPATVLEARATTAGPRTYGGTPARRTPATSCATGITGRRTRVTVQVVTGSRTQI